VLYSFSKDFTGRYRSEFIYRGNADSSWDLSTTLKRLGGAFARLEEPLLRAFSKYAEPGLLPTQSVWVKLTVGQHHGLPTRLLDWTWSPRVAVHFATADENYYTKDAAIWCVHPAFVWRLLPRTLLEMLQHKYAYMFTIDMLDELVPSLDKLDNLADPNPFMLFFEPPSIDGRIVNQAAIFSVISSPTVQPTDILKHVERGTLV